MDKKEEYQYTEEDLLEPVELKKKFLVYFRKLPVHNLAGNSIGRSDDTISIWKKKDPAFSELISRAESDWAMDNVLRIRNREWLLERILKKHFSQRNEITGPNGKDIIPIYGGQSVVQGHDGDKKDIQPKEKN
jgi:hypothetical protein